MIQILSLTAVSLLLLMPALSQSISSQSTITKQPSSSLAASSTHIPLFGVGSTTIPVVGVAGSIVGVDTTATTVALNCHNTTSCAIGTKPVTLTQGPSTWVADIVTQTDLLGQTGSLNIGVACNIVSSTQGATCTATGTVTIGPQDQSSAITLTTTTTIPSSRIHYDQLLITAGVEKLNSSPATQTSTAAAVAVTPLPGANTHGGLGSIVVAAVVAAVGMLW